MPPLFATLTGPLPRVLADGRSLDDVPAGEREAAIDTLVRDWLAAQEAAGLEPVTDGQVRTASLADRLADAVAGLSLEDGTLRVTGELRWERPAFVADWRATSGATSRLVKQALPGPYSLGRALAGDAAAADSGPRGSAATGSAAAGSAAARRDLTLALAGVLRAELRALAEAGCAYVEVEEPAATAIADDDAERALFRDAQARLLDGTADVHVSLALTGGDVAAAGAATLLAAPYASILLDLVRGPDGWRIATALPATRGLVCGVLPVGAGERGDLALIAWAAAYAASTGGRGAARVGLATAGGSRELGRDGALERIGRLGEALRVVTAPPREPRRDQPLVRGLPGAPVPGRPPRPRPTRRSAPPEPPDRGAS